jgi:uncharacterized protein YcaQ
MPKNNLPSPTISLSKAEARRFMLAHHHLWPPRQLTGKAGVMQFFDTVGSIQFDPIDRVGRNPDLVLQSRIAGYRPGLLEELLYADRLLLDGYDKVASVYPTDDWPCFARHRAEIRKRHPQVPMRIPPPMAEEVRRRPPMEIAPEILGAIRQRGPLSSLDLQQQDQIDWHWGQPTTVARALLETLYAMGELVVHHRVGTRRAFELAERALPADLYAAPDPHGSIEAYHDWHVLRRIGGLGLASPGSGEHWQGILGMKSASRQATLSRLVDRGRLVAVAVEGLPDRTPFMRTADLPTLETVRSGERPEPEAAIIAALDNLIWDRDMVRWIFDFDYVWEVYKPAAKRIYGYYVLPIIYDDRFVARFDPAWERDERLLTITDWWWEEEVRPDEAMEAALIACLREFKDYLGAERIAVADQVANDKNLHWVPAVNAETRT